MTITRFDPRTPFRSADGVAAGITRAALRGSAYRRLLHDCYVDAAVPVTDELLARAALTVVPDAYGLSHHSAATRLGGSVPSSPKIHLAVGEGRRCAIDGIRAHRYSAPPPMIIRRGIPVTDHAQTFLDLAESLELVDQVVLGDALARKGPITPAQLVDAADRSTARACRSARRAARLVRAEVDSAMETRARLLLVLAGLPEPVVNVVIRDRSGHVVRRLDLAYPDASLAIEYDGRHHIEREQQWRQDLLRREDLESWGWRFLVLVSDDIYVHPARTIERTTRLMRQAGLVVPELRTDWRRHFPGR